MYNLGQRYAYKEIIKQREVQQALMARRAELAEHIGVATREYDELVERINSISKKIRKLKCMMKY